MASQHTTGQSQTEAAADGDARVSWWSWRPGIRPLYALIIGGPIALITLLLVVIGLFTLMLGILDTASPPQRVPGVVIGHSSNFIGQLHVSIRLHVSNFPPVVSPTVTETQSRAIHDGDAVLLDYSPHLLVLYALEDAGRVYALPGSSIAGSLFGAAALLLIGLILFPYPALLVSWGWRDLLAETERLGERSRMRARVVALRAASQGLQARVSRPGLTSRFSRSSWHGVALAPPPGSSLARRPVTFGISRDLYERLREGEMVEVVYAPHLHYVYTLDRVTADE